MGIEIEQVVYFGIRGSRLKIKVALPLNVNDSWGDAKRRAWQLLQERVGIPMWILKTGFCPMKHVYSYPKKVILLNDIIPVTIILL